MANQQLHIDSKTYIIPPKTAVFVNNAAVQYDERHWGPDVLLWRPSRWIQKPEATNSEELIRSMESKHMGWGGGPRICPGKKFAQVEFAAALACLVREYRVEAMLEEGEMSQEQARERLLKVMADSDMGLAMRVNHPERLRLRWRKRHLTSVH